MGCSLLINEPPLQILPTLAQRIGLNEAIILQQVHYWLNPKMNKNLIEGRYWVWNTYEQWQQQFPFWGEKTIRRTIGKLEELGLLETFMTRDFKRLKYYTISYSVLEKISENPEAHPGGQNDQVGLPKQADRSGHSGQTNLVTLTRPYIDTENTSENTHLPTQEDDEEKVFQTMISVWNDVVQKKFSSAQCVHLTPKRRDLLSAFVTEVRTSWQDYCVHIAHTRFLMGENSSGFRVSLEWALKPDNAYKILEGAIYDKCSPEKPLELTSEDVIATLRENLSELNYGQDWLSICEILISVLGEGTMRSWFLSTKLIDLSDQTATLQVPSTFHKSYLSTHFQSTIVKALQCVRPGVVRVVFQVAQPSLNPQKETS